MVAPIVVLILGKVLDYIAENADEIVDAIKDEFLTAKTDTEVQAAIQEFGYAPDEESLGKLHDLLEKKGEDVEKLASILVTKTIV